MTSDTYELRGLYENLRPDKGRRDKPFSEDIAKMNEVLFRGFFTQPEKQDALNGWLNKHQPCFFGRVAAGGRQLHYCMIDEQDLLKKSDAAIAQKIKSELLQWKRRSLDPSLSVPGHGFVLLVYSQALADAAPDEHLYAFACKVRELWGCAETQEASGTMFWETLYLRAPKTKSYLKFTFSVDYFGAQGDGQWWHDHRCPGGIMFTANSVGYMKKYREWYKGTPPQDAWIIELAMMTIDEAEDEATGKGPATRLIPLGEGGVPMIEDMQCPFPAGHKMKDQLKDRDWTKYLGSLHTDHSIRPEFFSLKDQHGEHELAEHIQDFTYLYDPATADYARFVAGAEVAQDEVDSVLGSIKTWQKIAGRVSRSPISKKLIGAVGGLTLQRHERVPPEEKRRLVALLNEVRSWQTPHDHQA